MYIATEERVVLLGDITACAACVIFSKAGDLRSNPVSYAPLVHATRTLLTDADERVRELFTGREVTFGPIATVRDLKNSDRASDKPTSHTPCA